MTLVMMLERLEGWAESYRTQRQEAEEGLRTEIERIAKSNAHITHMDDVLEWVVEDVRILSPETRFTELDARKWWEGLSRHQQYTWMEAHLRLDLGLYAAETPLRQVRTMHNKVWVRYLETSFTRKSPEVVALLPETEEGRVPYRIGAVLRHCDFWEAQEVLMLSVPKRVAAVLRLHTAI